VQTAAKTLNLPPFESRRVVAGEHGEPPETSVRLLIACKNLPRGDAHSESDPLVAVYRLDRASGGDFVSAGQTEHVLNEHDPFFLRSVLLDAVLDAGDDDVVLRVCVYDVDDNEHIREDDMLASTVVSLRHLTAKLGRAVRYQLVDGGGAPIDKATVSVVAAVEATPTRGCDNDDVVVARQRIVADEDAAIIVRNRRGVVVADDDDVVVNNGVDTHAPPASYVVDDDGGDDGGDVTHASAMRAAEAAEAALAAKDLLLAQREQALAASLESATADAEAAAAAATAASASASASTAATEMEAAATDDDDDELHLLCSCEGLPSFNSGDGDDVDGGGGGDGGSGKGKCDPLIAVYARHRAHHHAAGDDDSEEEDEYQYAGQTEFLTNVTDPSFETSVCVPAGDIELLVHGRWCECYCNV
jgi:hypothetical protein